MCKCKIGEIIAAVVILVIAIWPTIVSATLGMWLTIIAAAIILIHAIACGCHKECSDMASAKPKTKKKR
ncbi:MAG: hypothetical protein AABW81_03600 [Nanoarchaeota archaeon]